MVASLCTSSSWRWEILAVMINLLCLCIMIALLKVYDSQPIFSWHGVTLNTVISLLSTSGKAALLFAVSEALSQWKWILFASKSRPLLDLQRIDSSSRGPWGSLSLLWPSHELSRLWLGAFVTITALALDPFAQQLVQYSSRVDWSDDVSAQIPLATRYSKGLWTGPNRMQGVPYSTGYIDAGTLVKIDFAMQSAILYGLAQSIDAVVQQTTFTCPSGNCTWDPFESLAVCSKCSGLESNLSYHEDDLFLWIILPGNGHEATFVMNGTTFLLPNGAFINNALDYPRALINVTTYGTGQANETVSLRDNHSLIWAMTMLRARDANDSSFSWPDHALEALECGLYYCVKHFRSNVINGKLFEQELELNIPRNASSWTPTLETDRGGNPLNWTKSDLQNIAYDDVLTNIPRSDLMFGDRYQLSESAVYSISKYFQDEFAVSVNPLNLTNVSSRVAQTRPATNPLRLNGWYMERDHRPDIMQAVAQSSNLTKTFSSLARSMTNALRAGADNSTVVQGKIGKQVTLYQIKWPWITLHAILFLAGVSFLAVSMYATSSLNVPVWRSSSLALLSLGSQVGNSLEGIDSVIEMEKKASRHYIRLFRSHGQEDTDLSSRYLVQPPKQGFGDLVVQEF